MAALKYRLARIEDRLRARSRTQSSTPPVRREPTDEELIEIGLILLAYVHKGDMEAYAQDLVKHYGFNPEGAKVFAEMLGALLEERSVVAEDPRRAV